MVKTALFYFLLGSDVFLLLAVLISLLFPEKRIYPPPAQKSWQNYSFLFFHHASLIGFFVLGGFDWNSFLLVQLAWKISGGIILAAGLIFAFWAVGHLSLSRSAGYSPHLITSAPYRFSRNPQVIGFLASYTGYILLANSLLTFWIGLITMAYVFLTPFTEEKWLARRLGMPYQEYCAGTTGTGLQRK